MYRNLLIYVFCCIASLSFSQFQGFSWPIDSPRVLTGNYGELRPNHFHAGLDFSTGGKISLPVYAAAEGHVSRIKVSATGYGKSVYITHANGKVTVYAHLNSYSIKLAALVKKEQYAKKRYEVEFFPKPGEVTIRKGEIIGLSGNTGGSTGPHLHFEIRDEKTETPLNPLTFFKIKEQEPPVIQKIAFYSLADTSSPVYLRSFKIRQVGANLRLEKDTIVLGDAIVGFAFAGFDRSVQNGNPNNIFSALLYLDDKLIYSHMLNKIDFADNRYVNEFSETKERLKFQKCFLPTLYPPKMYGDCFNKGRIILSDSNYHHLKCIVADESGNKQQLQCYVKTNRFNYYHTTAAKSDLQVICNKTLITRKKGLSINIPEGTLFYSTPLLIENALETNGRLVLLPSNINFKSAAGIGFKVPQRFIKLQNKLVLKSGSTVYPPTNWSDSVFFAIKNFGSFQLLTDSVGPRIKTQLPAKQLKRIKSVNQLSFVVSDGLSGLAIYNLFINNSWVIGEYDAKNDLVTYYFDEDSPTGKLEFRLEAEDKVGNKSVFNYTMNR